MAPKPAKFNAQGRRIGDSHPRAVLTDHEVALLAELLDERERIVEYLQSAGVQWHVIGVILAANELSFRCLAVKFEISKSQVANIAAGRDRCQTPYT